MEHLCEYLFIEKLGVDPANHPLLLTDSILNDNQTREKVTELMFDRFNVPKFYMELDQVLAIFDNGLKTGVAVDFGHTKTYIVPIVEGKALDIHETMNFGGYHITKFIKELRVIQFGYKLSDPTFKIGMAHRIKRKHCYVALDPEQELKRIEEMEIGDKTFEIIVVEIFLEESGSWAQRSIFNLSSWYLVVNLFPA